jgi:hypothetical protein
LERRKQRRKIFNFKMPSFKQIFGAVVGLATVVMGAPMEKRAAILFGRQNPATGLPDGLGDVDVLQLYVALFLLYTLPISVSSLS